MDWLKKNKDWLITLGVFGFFGILLVFTSVFFGKNGQEQSLEPIIEEEVKFDLPTDKQDGNADTADNNEPYQTTSFFLKPSPEELLTKLESLSYQEFRKETKKLPGLRIMWPAYFFSIVKVENEKAQVMLDASEDGFGVILVTEIDTAQYPEILQKKQGEKIWLAAEITGVDPTGTGQFFLNTEYVRFDDYKPNLKPSPPAAATEN
ncbi:MAG: hypothetical protein QNJ17_15440 [Desulfocapsaceae bacterium]|nr:hypothetical protein [Desulfocapsaceae bacterium]